MGRDNLCSKYRISLLTLDISVDREHYELAVILPDEHFCVQLLNPKLLPQVAISGGFKAGVCMKDGVMYLLLSALGRVYFQT